MPAKPGSHSARSWVAALDTESRWYPSSCSIWSLFSAGLMVCSVSSRPLKISTDRMFPVLSFAIGAWPSEPMVASARSSALGLGAAPSCWLAQVVIPCTIARMWVESLAFRAYFRAPARPGTRIAISTAMIDTTTSSSISVNARAARAEVWVGVMRPSLRPGLWPRPPRRPGPPAGPGPGGGRTGVF